MLVEFIADVADKFGFQAHTAGLAWALFDQFVQRAGDTYTTDAELELAAAVCLRIAAKFVETRAPRPDDLCKLLQDHPVSSARQMDKALLNKTELVILETLDWELHVLTPHPILDILLIVFSEPVVGAVATHARLLVDMYIHSASACMREPAAVAGIAFLVSTLQLGSASSSHPSIISSICRTPIHVLAELQDTMLHLFEQLADCPRPPPHYNQSDSDSPCSSAPVPPRDVSPVP
jgi:hypothetical protein